MKICKKCGLPKELVEFRVDRGYVRGECRSCEREAMKKRDPVKLAAAARKWSKENPEKRNAIKRAWYAKNKSRYNIKRREKSYGMVPGQFEEMLSNQKGLCAICNDALIEPHVDHCHETGMVRGLLCNNCNSGLGFFQESFSMVIRAASYLHKTS